MRILKLKKLPKGKFHWKVTLWLADKKEPFGFWERYHEGAQVVTPEVMEFLHKNISGRFSLSWLKSPELEQYSEKRYDAIYFENQVDVMLFKLTFNNLVRNIFKIEVDKNAH